jgi:hypothetical protein
MQGLILKRSGIGDTMIEKSLNLPYTHIYELELYVSRYKL